MKDQSSVTVPSPHPIPETPARFPSGFVWGALGVLAFSFTVPFTRVAVSGGLDPIFVGGARALVAAVLAGLALAWKRPQLPRGRQWLSVAVVACGVVLGFPLLTSLALRSVDASRAAVVTAILPATTAVLTCLRTRERPWQRFWWAAAGGALACVAFMMIQSGGLSGLGLSDLMLLGAVLLCALGYAEGGLLSKTLGSWQTISWALLLAAPFMAVIVALRWSQVPPHGSGQAWAAFAYLGVFSMFLGFLAWYRGLALGPMLQVSQIQLAQPLLTLLWSALLLGEQLGVWVILGAAAVLACTALAVRSR